MGPEELNENIPSEEGAEPEPWAGPSQEEWTQTQELLQGLAPVIEYMQNPEAGQYQQVDPNQEQMDLDPFSDNFGEQLRSLIQNEISPLSEFTENAALEEAEERAMDIIHDLESREGEFLFRGENPGDVDSRQVARSLAERFLPEAQQRYGYGPRAAEAALAQAYKVVRSYEETVGKTYHDRQTNQLKTLAGARREMPVAGTQGANNVSTPEGGDERGLVEAYFPRATGR
jgi:hypothetical protein